MDTEDGIVFLQMENRFAVPGHGWRSAFHESHMLRRSYLVTALLVVGCTGHNEAVDSAGIQGEPSRKPELPDYVYLPTQTWREYAVDKGWSDADSLVQVGTTYDDLCRYFRGKAIGSGTLYWGGSGRKRAYFHLPDDKQIWFEISGLRAISHPSCVDEIGPVEEKRSWQRLDGDSIAVDWLTAQNHGMNTESPIESNGR